jgi:acetyl-CoA carboxylase biotin carboxyl carrier protein
MGDEMTDLNNLKALVELMVKNDLTELDVKDEKKAVTIKRGAPHTPAHHVVHSAPVMHAPPLHHHHAPGAPPPPATPGAAPADDTAGLVAIESPMVGSFYSAASPDSPPFVSVGSQVGPDTVVCLIEAMKVFNEVKAERPGRIERILVKSGDAVEFGQKLFLVRPA